VLLSFSEEITFGRMIIMSTIKIINPTKSDFFFLFITKKYFLLQSKITALFKIPFNLKIKKPENLALKKIKIPISVFRSFFT
jgi:hypothetical protein